MQLRLTIAKNVAANLVRGGATAVVALALPHFLAKSLDRDRFAAWCLMLQIAAYASYVDFGLQTAVARFFARYSELGDLERRDGVISTAVAFLSGSAAVAAAAFAVVVWRIPHIFGGIPNSLVGELRFGVILVGGAETLLLPLSTFSGVLIGLHRNEQVALAVGGSRVAGATAVLMVVSHTSSIVCLGACMAVANVLGGLLQVAMVRRLLPSLRIRRSSVQRAVVRELAGFCGSLSVWSASMFLVNGLDLTLVGAVDFRAVGYYSVAACAIGLGAGANSAVCSALMAPIAALQARGQKEKIRNLVLVTSRGNSFGNVAVATAIFVFGYRLFLLWVGPVYAGPATTIAEILVAANAIRLAANPYATMLIATGQQRLGLAQGLVEGVSNVLISVIGAVLWGPVGVAWGTFAGAICGVAWACLRTARAATAIPIGGSALAIQGILRPLSCALPMLVFAIVLRHLQLERTAAWGIGCGLLSCVLTVCFGGILPTAGVRWRGLPVSEQP